MITYFDVTTPNSAYNFLINTLEIRSDDLIMEYLVECRRDSKLFCERNKHRFNDFNIRDVRFVALHVTASLDDCKEIKENGIRNLQYVLSHDTMLSRLLKRCGFSFDIEKRVMLVNGIFFNIDYENYRGQSFLTPEEECLNAIAHRVYYDFCIDGFWVDDNVEGYGTNIHERPEFISTLTKLSPKVEQLENSWKNKSKPYKVFFYATVEQIQKSTFNLETNYDPYTEVEEDIIKNWMVSMALDQAFGPEGEHYIYIRDNEYIPPEQIIRYETL